MFYFSFWQAVRISLKFFALKPSPLWSSPVLLNQCLVDFIQLFYCSTCPYRMSWSKCSSWKCKSLTSIFKWVSLNITHFFILLYIHLIIIKAGFLCACKCVIFHILWNVISFLSHILGMSLYELLWNNHINPLLLCSNNCNCT